MQILYCVILVLCSAAASSTGEEWWRNASVYQIYPRSFKDSDGDGVGDLKGIEQQADYFVEIGVSAVWLSPIQKSPMVDFGYDVADYKSIDPLFGNMEDFLSLRRSFEKKGIKLLLDFVPNHTSDQHPWFKMSLNRTDPYTDFYVWSDGNFDNVTGKHTPPNNWVHIFGESAWEWSEERNQFYLHQFLVQQPDLNYRNPKVVQAMEDVIRFWLDHGVDGFRVDAPMMMFESKNLSQNEPYPGISHVYTQHQNETFELLERWAEMLYNYSIAPGGKHRLMMLEAFADLKTTMRYYGSGNTSLMIPFNFQFLMGGWAWWATATNYKPKVDEWMAVLPAGQVSSWVVGNHDFFRLASACGADMVDAINMLTSTLPGMKVTYYGEEIGMEDTFVRWSQTQDTIARQHGPFVFFWYSRDPIRTPMQWDDTINAGFSTNSTPWLPVNPNYWWLNVAAQRSAQNSHLKVFQEMMRIRKDPVLRYGNLTTLALNEDTFIVVRSYEQSTYVLIINLGSSDSVFTSQATLAPQNLDMDMEVVVTSSNLKKLTVGDVLKAGSIVLDLRPKAAILLKSPPSHSSTASTFSTPLVLIIGLIVGYCR